MVVHNRIIHVLCVSSTLLFPAECNKNLHSHESLCVNIYYVFICNRQKLEQTQIFSNWGVIKNENEML